MVCLRRLLSLSEAYFVDAVSVGLSITVSLLSSKVIPSSSGKTDVLILMLGLLRPVRRFLTLKVIGSFGELARRGGFSSERRRSFLCVLYR